MPFDSSTTISVSESQNSALDRPLTVTEFRDKSAKSKREIPASLRELVPLILKTSAPDKDELPYLKLARFGDARSAKGALRRNANVLAIDGVEGDHDAGTMPVADAAALLRAEGVAALIYTTPSHTPEKPRWRVLCPTSASLPPADRERLCASLNGILGGVLARESFTLSQGFHFGSVRQQPACQVELIEGTALDLVPSDASLCGPMGKDGKAYRPAGQPSPAPPAIEAGDDDELDAEADWENIASEPDWDSVASALDAIPAAARDSRDTWLEVGMALHDGTGGSEEGFAAWDEWSQVSGKHDADDQRRTWESFGGNAGKRTTLGTLYHLARQHGWEAPAAESTAPAEPGRLAFLSPGECAAAPSRGYVVKGMVAPGDLGCIFGAPGAGKSLIAPHIGFMVARGEAAFGMRTRPGGVFYVAAEDPHGMRGRVTALKLRHGDAPGFFLVEGVSDLARKDSPNLAALAAAVAERRPALIVLDTLAMAFPGLEENSAEGMGRVVKVARKLTQHGAAVLLIHHDTKAEGLTPRGHSSLNGALDMALYLTRDDQGIVRGRLTKNRNGPSDRTTAFRIATRELGQDEDGDAITAALVDELADAAPRAEKLTAPERAALDILNQMAGLQGTAIREADWRRTCIERRDMSGSDNPDSRRKAMDRAMAGLARKGRIEVRAGFVSVPDAGDDWAELNENVATSEVTSCEVT